MTVNADIKEAMKEKKLVIGTRSTTKLMKRGGIKSVILPSNTPETIKRDIEHYSKVSPIEVKSFSGDSIQLGQICGKPFKIITIGIRK